MHDRSIQNVSLKLCVTKYWMKEKIQQLKVHMREPKNEKRCAKTRHTCIRYESLGSIIILEGHSLDKDVITKTLHNPHGTFQYSMSTKYDPTYLQNPSNTCTRVALYINVPTKEKVHSKYSQDMSIKEEILDKSIDPNEAI